MSAGWSVTYETATIQAGTAPTKEEAERIAANVHDSYVVKGLNPDALAWHVQEKDTLGEEHMRSVHGDGSECQDGCDMAVLPRAGPPLPRLPELAGPLRTLPAMRGTDG